MSNLCAFGFGASGGSGGATINAGTVVGQTTYWDGSFWQPSSILQNDNTTVGAGRAPISGTTFAVDNTSAAAISDGIRVSNLAASSEDAGASIVFSMRGVGESEVTAARIRAGWEDPSGDEPRLHLETWDSSSAYVLGVTMDKEGNVGIGAAGGEPSFQLDIPVLTSSAASLIRILNSGTGDASMRFSVLAQSYTLGVDNSDNDLFKISSSGSLTAGAMMAFEAATGFVGICTATSASLLQIDTNITANAWGTNGIQFNAGGTNTFTDDSTAGSGTAATAVINSFRTPTLAATNASVTTTDAATVYIQGAVTAGANQTITNEYSLWVDSGKVRIDDQLGVGVISEPMFSLHVYEDSVSTTALIVAEQDGTGDATYRAFLTGGRSYVWGIDNGDGDKWKLGGGSSIGGGNPEYMTVFVTSEVIFGQAEVGVGSAQPVAHFEINSDVTRNSWTTSGVAFDVLSATFTNANTAMSGTAASAVISSFSIPTLAATNTSVTTTDAANVYIEGAVAAGTNQTITNPWSLWIDAGDVRIDDNLIVGGTSNSDSRLVLEGNKTADAWAASGILFNAIGGTFTDDSTAGSGTATRAIMNSFQRPTLAATNASVTTTYAATVWINNSPAAGTNMTITHPYSLWIAGGNVRMDGNLTLGGTETPTARLELLGSMAFGVTSVVSSTYTIDTEDNIIGVNHTLTAAVTLTLPLAANAPNHILTIKDEEANAGTNNIDIDRAGSDTIVDITTGNTQTSITTNGGAIRLYNDGVDTWYVF